jgi:HAD superfamily hydrolase (TIGR01509 family)
MVGPDPAPRAALFDLDGVLVDTFEVWFHLTNDVVRRLGYPAIPKETYRARWGQGVEAEVPLYYPRHTPEAIRALYDAHYANHLAHLRVIEGAAGFLADLRIPKAVVTNCPVAIGRRALAVARLESFFETVVGCDEVARSKPAPDMVFEACRRLGVEPRDAVVVGDSPFDEGAARAAGTAFRWFRSFADLRL